MEFGELLLELDFGHDGLELGLHTVVGRRQAAKLGQALQAVCLAALQAEPTRAVREEVDSDAEEDGANHLKAERKTECDLAFELSEDIVSLRRASQAKSSTHFVP